MGSLLDKFLELEKPEKAKPPEELKPPPKAPKTIDVVEEQQEGLGIIQQIAMELVSDWDFLKGLGRSIKKVFPKQLKGINLRTSNEKIVEQFDRKIKEVNEIYDVVEQLKKQKEGDYRIVMNELKKKLEKQKEKIENENNNTRI